MSDPETVPIPMPVGLDEPDSAHSWRNHPWWIPDAMRFDQILWPLPLRPSQLSILILFPVVFVVLLGVFAGLATIGIFMVLVMQLIDGRDEFFAWMLAWGTATSCCTTFLAARVLRDFYSATNRFDGFRKAVQAVRLAKYIDRPNAWPMHWGSYEAKLMAFGQELAGHDRSNRWVITSSQEVDP